MPANGVASAGSVSGPRELFATPAAFRGTQLGPGVQSQAQLVVKTGPNNPAPTPIRPNALINFSTATVTSRVRAMPSQQQHSANSSSNNNSNSNVCGGGAGLTATATCIRKQLNLPKALSPSSSALNDSLPSQILPHLFVGNQEQTNRETINKLNIKYILSLGLLPMISTNLSPTTSNTSSTVTISPNSPGAPNAKSAAQHQQLPAENSSIDFKIAIRSNTPTTPTATTIAAGQTQRASNSNTNTTAATTTTDENKGVKPVRSIHCKCINISDSSDQLLMKFFDEAYAFIEEARRKKCNILIHCLAGISRSPTIAIAYLMRVKSLHWEEAYDLVKQCRPQIDPNLNFMGQLRIYNRSLRDSQVQKNTSRRRTNNAVGSMGNLSKTPTSDAPAAVTID